MALWPLTFEIIITFLLSAGLLYRYSNWVVQNVIVTVSVFIAWFFSFIVIFILPLDISSTAYRQCLYDFNQTYGNHSITSLVCQQPWSYAPGNVLPTLWRIVYWTSQALTWIVLPLMQSYSMAGDFTVLGKLRSSFFENLVYYGSFAVIFVILLIYVALKRTLTMEYLKVVCITASNTWGLILLIILLGYGLVEIPRSCFENSQYDRTLNYLYFKVAKLSAEKCEAEEKLEDALDEVQHAYESVVASQSVTKRYVDIILTKCPEEWCEKLLNRAASAPDRSRGSRGVAYNEKTLVRLHQNVIRASQARHRTKVQWDVLIKSAVDCEDISKNEVNPTRTFKRTIPRILPATSTLGVIREALYTPKVEWYWKCVIRNPLFKCLGYVLTALTVAVLWSEMTFSVTSSTLSIYALIIQFAKETESYLFMDLLSGLSLAYLSICAFYTVFKIRVFNYYYLAPHHQTDEYSLIFCGMLLCRLAPPLCLNYLGLIHLDSHVTKVHDKLETYFTEIMGHMDVISFISDGFNIYLPIIMCLFCLATFLQFGSRILHFMGIEQFIQDDDMTTELIKEGRELVKREKNKRVKHIDTGANRDRWTAASSRNQVTVEPELMAVSPPQSQLIASPNEDGSRLELLSNSDTVDYSTTWSTNRSMNQSKPSTGIFDDI